MNYYYIDLYDPIGKQIRKLRVKSTSGVEAQLEALNGYLKQGIDYVRICKVTLGPPVEKVERESAIKKAKNKKARKKEKMLDQYYESEAYLKTLQGD